MKYRKLINIIDYCNTLYSENLVTENDSVSLRLVDGGMYIASPFASKKGMAVEDIRKVESGEAEGADALHEAVYKARADVNAVMVCHSPFCVAAAVTEDYIPAALDDMAQIIGRKAVVARSSNPKDIIKALKKSGACLVRNEGVVTTGRTLNEAYTAALVLEKGAKAYIEATVLGGAKRIRLLDALLMRFFYLKKYSKADQEAKMEELNV